MAVPIVDFRPGGAEDDDDDFDDGFYLGDGVFSKPKPFDPVQQSDSVTIGGRGGFGKPSKKVKQDVPVKKLSKTEKATNKNPAQALSLGDFHMAILRGQKNLVEEYLQQGCNVDAVLKCGWTGLMYACSVANSSIVQVLLENGGNPNFHNDMYTVIMAACGASGYKEEDVLKCVNLLLDKGSEVNSYDRYHTTPLMYAAREGRPLVIERLVTAGANVNKQDSRGWTALTWAVSKNRKAAVKTLMDQKSDPKMKHSDGQTAVDVAYSVENDEIAAMLEGRKPQQNGFHGNSLGAQGSWQNAASIQPGVDSSRLGAGDSSEDASCGILYGELELFLCGLDLQSLVPLFQSQHVDFSTFLQMSDEDLIKMGISQIGIRSKILDGIHTVHKKEWEKSSLPVSLNQKRVSCAETIAIVANVSKHGRYIGSTLQFIQDQMRHHPNLTEELPDGTGAKQLHQHTVDALHNVQQVRQELETLQCNLEKMMKNGNFDPPDAIQKLPAVPEPYSRFKIFSVVSMGMICVGIVVKRNYIYESVTTLLSMAKS